MLVGFGDAVSTVEKGVGVGAAVVGCGVGVATGTSETPDCKTELVNSAPASAFPGCNNTTKTRMTQARINNPYKT